MPTYTFYNSKTKNQWDDMMSNSEREIYLKNNPEINQVPGGFMVVGDHIMGAGPKVDGGFTENMQRQLLVMVSLQVEIKHYSKKHNAI